MSVSAVYSNKYFVWISALIVAILGAYLHAHSWYHLWIQWQTPEYGHGMLLPVIALGWGLYSLQSKPIVLKASFLGLGVIAAALLINALGALISNNWISNIATVIFITGMVWSFLGFSALKRVAPALILLLFAIPLPMTILPVLTADLQLISSSMGVGMLKMLGISVYQEGNIIDLGGHKLDVAIACSGLQYLFPLLSLSYLIAFFSFKTLWKRVVLFLSAIPITLGMNAARIAASGIIYNWFGEEAIEGTMHYVEGYFVFALCLVILMVFKFILDKCPPRIQSDSIFNSSFSLKTIKDYPYYKPGILFYTGLVIIMTVFLAFSFFISSRNDSDMSLPRESFYDFPLVIGNWTGTRDRLSNMELETLNLTDYFIGNYRYQANDDFAPMKFYVAYYDQQTQENSIHSPQICLPASGWVITDRSIHTVDSLNVNMEIMQKNNQKVMVYYWFREAGYDAASNLEIKKLMLMNALRNGRTDGSLIRLTAPFNEGTSRQELQNQMDDFLRNLLPVLPTYLPPKNS